MRSASGAEEEIRIFASQVARIMQTKCPLLFGDYTEEADGSWSTNYRKV
jgi:thymidylate synthase ThyX